jgi:hypothetical protein
MTMFTQRYVTTSLLNVMRGLKANPISGFGSGVFVGL